LTLSPSSRLGPIPNTSINPRLQQHLGAIVSAALSAVDARRVTLRALEGLSDSLGREGRVRVVAAGKAAVGMARAVDDSLGPRVSAGVLTAHVAGGVAARWRFHAATHPRPGPESEAAGRAALALADQAARDRGVLLVCLSGGASAMLAVPAGALTIADKAATTACLLRAGLDIASVNLVRRHLSAVKGGQLAARARRTITLAISDVCAPVEDDPMVIGSGPTAGDDTTFADALAVVTTHGLAGEIPAAALHHLREGVAGRVRGPVAPDDEGLREAGYWIVASRQDAMRAARETAEQLGYHAVVVAAPVVGEARLVAQTLAPHLDRLSRPACLISSGETTVHVRGAGRGGRNQEAAVAALEMLAARAPAALASVGTDGVDGPTDAAGALVDSGTWSRLGPDAAQIVEHALAGNDCYPLLDDLGVLIKPGPTGTNVGDLQVLLLP
jgi:hydroxypyruvate reductase